MRPYSFKTDAHAFLAIFAAGFLTVAPVAPALGQDIGASGGSVVGDAGSSVSVLLTRQNERTRLLEEDLQGLRGLVETDLRALKMQIMQLSNNASSDETTTSAEIRDLRDQVERLADAVAGIEERTGVPVTSSNHAMAWHCLRLAGIDDTIDGRGRLFTLPLPG